MDEELYNNTFPKPEFNWYVNNYIYFNYIKLWKKNKEIYKSKMNEELYNNTFPKPEFNWYSKNDTYFDDIKLWNKNKEIYKSKLRCNI